MPFWIRCLLAAAGLLPVAAVFFALGWTWRGRRDQAAGAVESSPTADSDEPHATRRLIPPVIFPIPDEIARRFER